MSQAKDRVEALGKQLSSGGGSALPAIQKVAGPSNGPRLDGKVAIITGKQDVSLAHRRTWCMAQIHHTYGKGPLR